ncbi:MAG: YigZ family protein [Bacteroidetes bacterium]|nr:YigZ family protein [Bacteroidota bacterium]
MLFDETYNTIESSTEGLFRDRGSKFMSYLFPIKTELDFKQSLSEIKEIHAKANHHCYAWRLTPSRALYKINDDGEPTGTAGKPILNQLLSKDLTDCAIIVVRYFGGTLLGVQGLIHAYKEAATDAITSATIINKEITANYTIQFSYELMNEVMRRLKNYNATITSNKMEEDCCLTFTVGRKNENALIDDFQQNYLFNGKLNFLYT